MNSGHRIPPIPPAPLPPPPPISPPSTLSASNSKPSLPRSGGNTNADMRMGIGRQLRGIGQLKASKMESAAEDGCIMDSFSGLLSFRRDYDAEKEEKIDLGIKNVKPIFVLVKKEENVEDSHDNSDGTNIEEMVPSIKFLSPNATEGNYGIFPLPEHLCRSAPFLALCGSVSAAATVESKAENILHIYAEACNTLTFAVRSALSQDDTEFDCEIRSALGVVHAAMSRAIRVEKLTSADFHFDSQAAEFLADEWGREVKSLKIGEILLWPLAHWGTASRGVYMLVIERVNERSYSVVVASGGSSLEYHAQKIESNTDGVPRLLVCETMTVPYVTCSKLTNATFIFTLLRLAAFPSPKHSNRVIYEVIIPFLEADSDNLTMNRSSSGTGLFTAMPTTPLSSMSRVLCHTVFRHLLLRYGVSLESIKRLGLGVRRALLKPEIIGDDFDGAERHGAEEGVKALAASALRCLSRGLIKSDLAALIASECNVLHNTISKAPPCPYTSHQGDYRTAGYGNGALRQAALKYPPQIPPLFPSLTCSPPNSPPAPAPVSVEASYDSLLNIVSNAVSASESLRSTIGMDDRAANMTMMADFSTEAVIAAQDIAAIICRACCVSLPAPTGQADCVWSRAGEDQRNKERGTEMPLEPLLKGLLSLSMHITAAVVSIGQQPLDRALFGTLAVVCAFLSCAADALVRGSETVCGAILRKFEVNTQSMSGASLADATGSLPLGPDEACLRSYVLKYWNAVKMRVPVRNEEEHDGVWGWSILLGNPTTSTAHDTFMLVSMLSESEESDIEAISKILIDGGAPAADYNQPFDYTNSSYNAPRARTDLKTTSDKAQSFPDDLVCLRDISLLAFHALQPPALAGIWISYESVRPVWETVVKSTVIGEVKMTSVRLKVMVGRAALDGAETRRNCWWSIADNPKALINNKKAIAEGMRPRGKGQMEEEEVLYIPELPSFARQVGSDEAERIISALTTPYIRIPLILGFLSSGHTGALSDALCRVLVDSVCFEPGKYAPSTESIFSVPVKMTSLCAVNGLMAEEMSHSADRLADCLITILKDLLEAGAGDRLGRSIPESYSEDPDDVSGCSVFQALLFGVSLAARCEGYARWVGEVQAADRIGEMIRGSVADALTALIETAIGDGNRTPSLAVIRVAMVLVEAWRYGPQCEIIKQAGDLLAWMALVRAWVDRALTTESGLVNQIPMSTFCSSSQTIGAVIAPMMASDQVSVSERNLLLSTAAAMAMIDSSVEESLWNESPDVPMAWVKGSILAVPLMGSIMRHGTNLQAVPFRIGNHPTFQGLFTGVDSAKLGCVPLAAGTIESRVLMYSARLQYVVRLRKTVRSPSLFKSGLPVVKSESFDFDECQWLSVSANDAVGVIGKGPVDCLRGIDQVQWWIPQAVGAYQVLIYIPKTDIWMGGRIWSSSSFQMNRFVPHDDGIWEIPVFCSDGWRCISDLPIPVNTVKADPYPHAHLSAGIPALSKARGSLLESVSGIPEEEVLDIWRLSTRAVSSWNLLVPSWKLEGMIPATLLNRFRFWRVNVDDCVHLEGEPMDSATPWSLSITLKHDTLSVIREPKDNSRKLRLLDLFGARKGTVLGALVDTLVRIEQLGHVLVWGCENDQPALVEMPRLNTAFEPGTGDCDLRLSDDPSYRLVIDANTHHPALPWAAPLINEAGERAWLVPNVRPVPRTNGDCIVLDADVGDKSRTVAVTRTVYVYQERESDRALIPPSTAASLYLFTLHLHLKQFAEASALIPMCASDGLSPEELWIASLVGGTALTSVDPSSAACRLQFYEVACLSNGMMCRWPILVDVWRYIQGHAHVIPQCRLSSDTEIAVLDAVLGMIQPAHPMHLRAPIAGPDLPPEPLGRMVWLATARLASLQGLPISSPVPFSVGGGWRRLQWSLNQDLRELKLALVSGKGWTGKLAPMAATNFVDGPALDSLWERTLSPPPSEAVNAAFLTICAAWRNKLPVGLGGNVEGSIWADLADRWLYLDSQPLQNMNQMQKSWPRASFMVLSALTAMRPEMFPEPPLNLVLSTLRQTGPTRLWCMNVVEAAIASTSTREWRLFNTPLHQHNGKPEKRDRYSLVPSLCPPFNASNAACGSAIVSPVKWGLDNPHILCDALDYWMLKMKPKPTQETDTTEDNALPFDIDHIPEAQSRLAAAKLDRMTEEMRVYSHRDAVHYKVDTVEIRAVIQILQETRDRDAKALDILNATLAEADECGNKARREIELTLLRNAGMGIKLSWKTVAIAMGSSSGLDELTTAFPLLREPSFVMRVTAQILMLHSRRLIARCALTLARMLLFEGDEGERDQIAGRLFEVLSTRRYHQQSTDHVSIDPRMLLIEHEAGIVLRKSQVDLVHQFEIDARAGSSRVQQMIMGQGKTTVVTPLLVLILSHASRLVTVAVPRSLLVLSRSCLMATLGSGWGRRVFTVEYGRTPPQNVTPVQYARSLRMGMERARSLSSPVITTASTLKAIVLCFAEVAGRLTNAIPMTTDAPDNKAKELSLEGEYVAKMVKAVKKMRIDQGLDSDTVTSKDAGKIMDTAVFKELAAVLGMFQQHNGILLMDEVDVILHPLKSELNFPVGPTSTLDLFHARVSLVLRLVEALTVSVSSSDEAVEPEIMAIQKALSEGIKACEWTTSPHLTLVDRETGFLPLLEPLANWIWPWFEHALDDEDLTDFATIATVSADSHLDEEHKAHRAVGGEGTGFWCSSAKPKVVPDQQLQRDPEAQARDLQRQREARESELIIEMESPCSLSSIEIGFVPLSPFFGASGQPMMAEWTEVYASSDGGSTWKHVGGSHIAQFCGTHVDLPLHTTKVSHLKLRLQGDATWFAVHTVRVKKAPQRVKVAETLRQNVIEYLISPSPDDLSGIPARALQLVNLARDVLQFYLPHVMSKRSRVEYGLLSMKDATTSIIGDRRRHSAVPFLGLDIPSPTSEFAHPDVLIFLTALAYKHAGLRQSDIFAIVAELKKRLTLEGGAVMARPTWRIFNEWLGKRAAGAALHLLDPSEPEQMAIVSSALSNNWDTISFYLREIVYPKILLLHTSMLSATGEELGDKAIFSTRFGFSGTPNVLLPRAMGPCRFEVGTEGHILHTLSSPLVVQVTSISGKWDLHTILRKVATHKPPLLSLIDAGALMVGLSNQAVAEGLLTYGLAERGIRGVVFLDENDRPLVVLADSRVVVPLGEDGIPPLKRFVFFDQIHCTGMDIKQSPNAMASVLLGKSMTMRDYSQACWRMRGLGNGQTIRVFVVDEVSRLVNRVVGADAGRCPSPSDVLAWLVVNEMRSENVQAARLQSLQITTVARRHAFASLMRFAQSEIDADADPPIESIRAYFGPTMAWMGPRNQCVGTDMATLKANQTAEDAAELAEIEVGALNKPVVDTSKSKVIMCGCLWPLFCTKSSKSESKNRAVLDRASLDTEVQNEKEQEQEVYEFEHKKIQPVWRSIDRPEIPWALNMIPKLVSGGQSDTAFNELAEFKVRSDVRSPLFPSKLLMTKNHTPLGYPAGTSRLKNVEVAMVIVSSGLRRVCLLTLQEAATVRYVALHEPESIGSGVSLALVDVLSGFVFQHVGEGNLSLSLSESGCLKLFNCELELNSGEVDGVMSVLDGDDRLPFIQQLVRHRRRESMNDSKSVYGTICRT